MVQNRTRTGNDTGYPTDGLLIWHVDARLDAGRRELPVRQLLHRPQAPAPDGGRRPGADRGGRCREAGDYYVTGKTLGPATYPVDARYDDTANPMLVQHHLRPGQPDDRAHRRDLDATAPTGAPRPTDEGVRPRPAANLVFNWTPGHRQRSRDGDRRLSTPGRHDPGRNRHLDGSVGNAPTWTYWRADGVTYYARVRAMVTARGRSAWSGNSDGSRSTFPSFPLRGPRQLQPRLQDGGGTPMVERAPPSSDYGATRGPEGGHRTTTSDLPADDLWPVRVLLSFWWRVFSRRVSTLSVFVDGVLALWPISGAAGWSQRQVLMGVGHHQVRWVYEKDSSLSSGSDAVWVDRVEWTPGRELGRILPVEWPTRPRAQPLSGVRVRFFNEAGSEVDARFVDSEGSYSSGLVARGITTSPRRARATWTSCSTMSPVPDTRARSPTERPSW